MKFTTKDTKHALSKVEGSTKFGILVIRNLRVLRAFAVKNYFTTSSAISLWAGEFKWHSRFKKTPT